MTQIPWHRSLHCSRSNTITEIYVCPWHQVHQSVLLSIEEAKEFLVPPCRNFASMYGRLVVHFPFSYSGEWLDGEGSDEIKLN
jgi:hypothetical protein